MPQESYTDVVLTLRRERERALFHPSPMIPKISPRMWHWRWILGGFPLGKDDRTYRTGHFKGKIWSLTVWNSYVCISTYSFLPFFWLVFRTQMSLLHIHIFPGYKSSGPMFGSSMTSYMLPLCLEYGISFVSTYWINIWFIGYFSSLPFLSILTLWSIHVCLRICCRSPWLIREKRSTNIWWRDGWSNLVTL